MPQTPETGSTGPTSSTNKPGSQSGARGIPQMPPQQSKIKEPKPLLPNEGSSPGLPPTGDVEVSIDAELALDFEVEVDSDFFDPTQDVVQVYRSKSFLRRQRYYWRRFAANGKQLSKSSEGYYNSAQAVAMARRCNSDVSVIDLTLPLGKEH